jgi:hypothetical protein
MPQCDIPAQPVPSGIPPLATPRADSCRKKSPWPHRRRLAARMILNPALGAFALLAVLGWAGFHGWQSLRRAVASGAITVPSLPDLSGLAPASAPATPPSASPGETAGGSSPARPPAAIEYTEDDLDYAARNQQETAALQMRAQAEAMKEFRKQHPDPNTCYLDIAACITKETPSPAMRIHGMADKNVEFKTIGSQALIQGQLVAPPLAPARQNGAAAASVDPTISIMIGNQIATYALSQIAPEYRHLFDDQAYQVFLQAELNARVPDFSRQEEDWQRIWKETEKTVYEAAGYAWSKKNRRWVPVKAEKLAFQREKMFASTTTRDTDILWTPPSDAPSTEGISAWRFAIALHASEGGASCQINGTVEGTHPVAGNTIRMKIYRGKCMEGPFNLIYDDAFSANPDKTGKWRTSAALQDPVNPALAINLAHYRMEFHDQAGTLLLALPPQPAPWILLPNVGDGTWSWRWLSPDGERIHGTILEVSTPPLVPFARDIHDIAEITRDIPPGEGQLGLLFTIPLAETLWASDPDARPASRDLTYRKALRPAPANKVNFSGICLRNAGSSGFLLTAPVDARHRSIELTDVRLNGTSYLKYTLPEYASQVYSLPKIPGIRAVDLRFRPLGSGETQSEELAMTLAVPPSPPTLRAILGPEGNKLMWSPSLADLVTDNFVVKPRLMLYKNQKILRECGEETSWLDPAPGPGPDSYTIQLEGGAWRSQAWNAKDGIVETHLILPTNPPTPSAFGPNQVSVYAPYPAAIHVGLRAPDCCHDHTGPLEGALMQSLAEIILDAPDMRLFNRFNRGAGYPVNPGLDFVIHLRDFSSERGNGIDVWLTQLPPRKSSARYDFLLHHSWRIGRVMVGDDGQAWQRDILAPLTQKIRGLHPCKAMDVDVQRIRSNRWFSYSLCPLAQAQVLLQAPEISEAIMLTAAQKNPDTLLLTDMEAGILIQERTALRQEGCEDKAITMDGIEISGQIWQAGKALHCLYFATNIETGEIAGVNHFSGTVESIASKVGAWLSEVTLPMPPSPRPNALLELLVPNESFGTFPRFYRVERNTETQYPAFLANLDFKNKAGVKKFAEQQWAQKNRLAAIQAMEACLKLGWDDGIAATLYRCYQEVGLHGQGVVLLEKIAAKKPDQTGVQKELIRARSLAKASSLNTPLFSRERGIAEKSALHLRDINDNNNIPGIKFDSARSNIENPDFPVLYHTARNQHGEEWRRDGQFYGREWVLEKKTDRPLCPADFVIGDGIWKEAMVSSRLDAQGATIPSNIKIDYRSWEDRPVLTSKSSCGVCLEFPEDAIRHYDTLMALANTVIPALPPLCLRGEEAIFIEKPKPTTGGRMLLHVFNQNAFLPNLRGLEAAERLSRLGNAKAQALIQSLSIKTVDTMTDSRYIEDVLIFLACRGDRAAEGRLLANDKVFLDPHRAWTIARHGRWELLKAMLGRTTPRTEVISALQGANPELPEKLLLPNPQWNGLFLNLLDGYECREAAPSLLSVERMGAEDDKAKACAVLLTGIPLPEIRERARIQP